MSLLIGKLTRTQAPIRSLRKIQTREVITLSIDGGKAGGIGEAWMNPESEEKDQIFNKLQSTIAEPSPLVDVVSSRG